MAQPVGRAPSLDPRIVVPEGFEIIGYKNGTPIVRGMMDINDVPPAYRKAGWKVARKNEDGSNVFRKDRKGNELGMRHKVERGKMEVSFWMRKSPRGHVRNQYDYQENPQDVVKRERQKKIAEFRDGLAAAAVDRGLTVDQLMDRLLVESAESVAQPKAQESTLPAVKALPGVLEAMTDIGEILLMRDTDTRADAAEHYEFRLMELEVLAEETA